MGLALDWAARAPQGSPEGEGAPDTAPVAHTPSLPDVMWTEFVSADGLTANSGSNARLRALLLPHCPPPSAPHAPCGDSFLPHGTQEVPLVAQLFGRDPDTMERAAAEAVRLGVDGVDINMGCPDAAVMGAGAGAALLDDVDVAVRLIHAARRGAAGAAPVSAKVRVGVHTDTSTDWMPRLLGDGQPDALTVHCRTAAEASRVAAPWERLAPVEALRRAHAPDCVLLANGDVFSVDDARDVVDATGVDGAMLARAFFDDPWALTGGEAGGFAPSPAERLAAAADHVRCWAALTRGTPRAAWPATRKSLRVYVAGLDRVRRLRAALVNSATPEAAVDALEAYAAEALGRGGALTPTCAQRVDVAIAAAREALQAPPTAWPAPFGPWE